MTDKQMQEPVGYITQARCFVHLHECTEAEAKLYGWKALYTTPHAQPAPVQQILAAFPLLDDEGLDQDEHHCEWALQQDRKRLHAMLAHGITKGQP